MVAAPIQRDRRYWIRLLRLALFATIVPIFLIPFLMGSFMMWSALNPPCTHSGTPANHGLDYREITIPSKTGSSWRGFFIPGVAEKSSQKSNSLIIAPPAYNGDRGGMLYETTVLAQAGYNVLMFESVVCAGRGPHSLGFKEVTQIEDTLNYLKSNPDNLTFDQNRIAMHGFSSAGATSIMAAERFSEIKAVLSEGNYHNMDARLNLGEAKNFFEALMIFGTRIVYQTAIGLDPSVLSPVDAIHKIPPRPFFLIFGSLEAKRGGAQLQLDAALEADPGTMAKLWIVEGVEHGGYVNGPGGIEAYKQHVIPFYDCALLQQCDAWNALWK